MDEESATETRWPEPDDDGARPRAESTKPVLATVLGLSSLLGLGYALSKLRGLGATGEEIVYLGVGAVFAIWIAAFLLAIRRASGAWITLSFFLFLLVGIGAGRFGDRAYERAMREDLAAASGIAIEADGRATFAPGARPGPIAAIMFRMAKTTADLAAERDARILTLGLDEIGDGETVARRPELLADCGRFPRAKPALVASEQAMLDARRDAVAAMRALAASNEGARAALPMLIGSTTQTEAQMRDLTALNLERLDVAGRLCAMLSERGWRPAVGGLQFADPARSARYYELAGQLDAAAMANDEVAAEAARRAEARRRELR